ncbi:hypothetical protein EMIT0111MI5_110030 [Burkholderia sp. IT-111MI5]
MILFVKQILTIRHSIRSRKDIEKRRPSERHPIHTTKVDSDEEQRGDTGPLFGHAPIRTARPRLAISRCAACATA